MRGKYAASGETEGCGREIVRVKAYGEYRDGYRIYAGGGAERACSVRSAPDIPRGGWLGRGTVVLCGGLRGSRRIGCSAPEIPRERKV